MRVKIIKNDVTHQDIGGRDFVVDEEITSTLSNSEVFKKAMIEGNIACMNFVLRRPDFKYDFPHKLYYGKVGGLGYIVSEDEFVEE